MKSGSLLLITFLCLCLLGGPASAETIITGVWISNESPGFLMDALVAAGYGSSSIFESLQYLQPYSGGAIPDSFMTTLAGAPPGMDAFEAPTYLLADWSNNPVFVGENGMIWWGAVYGRDYDGRAGYTTAGNEIPDLGTVLFTSADDPAYYIDSGAHTTGGETYYFKAFAIVWSADAPRAVPEPSSLLLAVSGFGAALLLRLRKHCCPR